MGESEMKLPKIENMVLGTVVALIVLNIGGQVNRIINQQYNDDCDENYGVDNWRIEEITGTDECRFFIGQCWKCELI